MTQPEAPAYTLRDKLKEALALAFITAGLFIFISLITYDEGDIRAVRSPANAPPRNSGGVVGAHLAYALFSNFGIAAYAAVFFACFWSFQAFFRRRVRGLYVKLAGALVAVLALATLASIQPMIGPGQVGLAGTAPTTGGVYGETLRLMLVENIGQAGALLAVLLSLAISMLLGTDWMVATAAAKLAAAGSAGVAWLRLGLRRKPKPAPVELARLTERTVAPRPPLAANLPPPAPEPPPAPAKPSGLLRARPAAELLPYTQPPLDLFDAPTPRRNEVNDKHVRDCAQIIERTLKEFHIEARVVGHIPGPSVTVYELELGPGIKTTKVLSLQKDLATKLAVPCVRVVAPLPGRTTVGVEVPNPMAGEVRFREFFDSPQEYADLRKTVLPLLLGMEPGGARLVQSLAEMPHLLIAGSTGFGKTVGLKAMITSMLCAMAPEELKLVLIDPKGTELTAFRDVPHLWAPVITDTSKASMILDWLVKEMDERYQLFERIQVNKISTYNRLGDKKLAQRLLQMEVDEQEWSGFPKRLPYIVTIIDELADLMMTSRRDVEASIIRLSQKSRAVGIHLILATQRPSADVVTGLIRSNLPGRISFRVPTHVESKIVLDHVGAEGLVVKGEMLMILPGMLDPRRAQGTLVTDEEVGRVIEHLRRVGPPDYHMELVELNNTVKGEGTEDDELFDQAVEVVLAEQRGSVSLVQRKLSIGYGRAARLIDSMERAGIVGPHNGANPREVLLTLEQWQELKKREAGS
jgi:S-DNA-T family DNA segregation ATPase FtsK/SpoIIIE